MKRTLFAFGTAAMLVATTLAACSGGSSSARTVLVDHRADEFASSFLHYYPHNVIVHPGDTVSFKVTWSGEPHSVTLGGVVDNLFKYKPLFEKYNSPEEALAAGVPQSTIDTVNQAFNKIPPMAAGQSLYQPGARPCFIPSIASIPDYSSNGGDSQNFGPSVACPAKDRAQPAFTGTQGLYNSGYIPFNGAHANSFVVPIAKNATPGTYNYFCNYHWIDMHGTVTIVPPSKKIPSASTVNHLAQTEIDKDAKSPLAAVHKANKGDFGGPKAPVAGVSFPNADNLGVQVNEFYPKTFHAKVGEPVTWTVQGADHTVSFNVPTYFPVYTVSKNGNVSTDKGSYQGVGWTVPPEPDDNGNGPSPPPRHIDVGSWDGSGGFHSSGTMSEGETFTVRFTKPGTYQYACVVHPPMIATIVIS